MNKEELITTLQLNNLFGSNTRNLITLFNESNYRISHYNKNTLIYCESQKCTTLDIILKGTIVVQKIDINGNILTITEFNTGDSMGGNLLFADDNSYPMSIISKMPCTVLHIKKELVLDLCQKDKEFLKAFLISLSQKAVILSNKISTLSIKSLRDSIIDFLKYEYYLQKNTCLKLNMTKKELSERLGVQRTSLSRELNKMRKDGLINYDSKSITIQDMNIIIE